MAIENVMYFALGLLAAGLLALMIMPAIWRRAVRLTKKRIEAATPMSMAEFRADKDQLRAEFALSTRRLEMNVEALRKRLAEQLTDINRKKTDLATVKSDRDNHLTIIRELEEREGELRRRVLELEKESAELSLKLRIRDREYSDKDAELQNANEFIRVTEARAITFDGELLSGEYAADTAHLTRMIEIERKRTAFLEQQHGELIARLEAADRRASETGATLDGLRRGVAARDDKESDAAGELLAAEARLAEAEDRLNLLLTDTQQVVAQEEGKTEQLLAEKLTLESDMIALRAKVEGVEQSVMVDWDRERLQQSHLRERLNDIASDVARLVYAVEGRDPLNREESLFDRVQRFADDGRSVTEFPVRSALQLKQAAVNPVQNSGGAVADRLAALRDIRSGS